VYKTLHEYGVAMINAFIIATVIDREEFFTSAGSTYMNWKWVLPTGLLLRYSRHGYRRDSSAARYRLNTV